MILLFWRKMLKIDNNKNQILFHLYNTQISYVIEIIDGKFVTNRYFGPELPYFSGSASLDNGKHAFSIYQQEDAFSVSSLPLEYSVSQAGDYRETSAELNDKFNLPIIDMKYVRYDQEKIKLSSLPHIRQAKGSSLNIHLIGNNGSLAITIHYFLLDDFPSIIRWISYKNIGKSLIHIKKADSLQLDVPNREWKTLSFYGTHANEFIPSIKPIFDGKVEINSTRGSSSPQHQPFIALIDKNFTLDRGKFISCNLIWSGNFRISIEKEQENYVRLNAGVNNKLFNYTLRPSEQFIIPQAIITTGQNGLGEMSRLSQEIISNYIVNSRIQQPLIALNTWEMSYFDVTEKKCIKALNQAEKIGANLLVIDDGWFNNRNSEKGQLGDWIPDYNKFPNGLKHIAELTHKKEMKFGIWIEPEMVTTSSDLFKKHPDWVLGLDSVERALYSRNQLVLDLSKKEVQNYLINIISNLIIENRIDYLKWDFNRQLAPIFSQGRSALDQGKVGFDYILGLYRILSSLREKFKNLIIENCAAGGGRMDLGMVYFTDQTWISDLTDALARFRIITNMATIYPIRIFSSHFSKSPNEQDGRILPIETRLVLSSLGSLGFELNLELMGEDQIDKIKSYVKKYKEEYSLMHDSVCLPLTPLREKATMPMAIMLKDAKKIGVIYSYGATDAVHIPRWLPLIFLDNKCDYKVNDDYSCSGVELNNAGLTIFPVIGDFCVDVEYLKKE